MLSQIVKIIDRMASTHSGYLPLHMHVPRSAVTCSSQKQRSVGCFTCGFPTGIPVSTRGLPTLVLCLTQWTPCNVDWPCPRWTYKEQNISLVRYVGPSDWQWYYAAIGIIRYITMKVSTVVFYKWPSNQLLWESVIDLVRHSKASLGPRGFSCSNPIWDGLSSRLKCQFVPTCIRHPSTSGVTKTMHR